MRTIRIAAAAVAIGFTAVAPAFAQADEHAHHRMAMAAPAPSSPSRVMEVQPTIADLVFTDQTGRKVSLRDAVTADAPVLVNFIFTSCTTICPVMSAGFANLQHRLDGDHKRVKLVSISIDPEVDTPSRLQEYAAGLGAGDSWLFLTGTVADAEAAQRAFGVFRGTKESHAAATFIRRTSTGKWEKLDGLASGDTLVRAYRGGEHADHDGGQQ
jgi:protein SCO1